MAGFWKSKSARILSFVLIAQAVMFYSLSRAEKVPPHKTLNQFGLENSDWKMSQELQLDKESLEVLKADDILSRVYLDQKRGSVATLFVAYFSTQRTGKTPHSPKNCLPGSGWAQTQSGEITINVPGRPAPITVNKYIISRGDNESVVLYWYQSHNRVVASEYAAKIYTVTDSIRYDRSDTALVRVVVGVQNGDRQKAVNTATSFVQTVFQPLSAYLPT